jgi:xylulokinase
MSLMGVDVGSSACKAVVFDESGRVLSAAAEGYEPISPRSDWLEMDPEVLWQAVAGAMSRAAQQTEGDPVAAVGLSSHGESLVPIDRDGTALGRFIMNADSRATEEAAWLEEEIGRERLFGVTGAIMHPMFPSAKLRWLQLNQPDLFASTASFHSVSEYILARLGLEPVIAYPLACRYLAFDVRELRWSEEILGAVGMSADRLPTPVPAGTAAGVLSPDAAAAVGITAGVPVVVGGHDQPCGALGMGALSPGTVTDSLGTYECIVAVSERPVLDDGAMAASLNSYCHVVPDRYITIAYFGAGVVVRWFCETFCGGDEAAAAKRGQDIHEYLSALAPAGPTEICITPHLLGSGTPHFDAEATGVIVGITQHTQRADVYKAILEGIACELAIISDILAAVVADFDTVRCSGGGARSSVGLRLRASITGRSMQTMSSPESVSLGAALLAGTSAGVYADLEEAVEQAVRVVDTIPPDEDAAGTYRAQIAQYRALYAALEPVRQIAARHGDEDVPQMRSSGT